MIEELLRCVCDECGENGPLVREGECPEEIARTSDWVCFEGIHYCPVCAKKKGLANYS